VLKKSGRKKEAQKETILILKPKTAWPRVGIRGKKESMAFSKIMNDSKVDEVIIKVSAKLKTIGGLLQHDGDKEIIFMPVMMAGLSTILWDMAEELDSTMN
jgi:hypothetical protein